VFTSSGIGTVGPSVLAVLKGPLPGLMTTFMESIV
jgi:hypothetical protein